MPCVYLEPGDSVTAEALGGTPTSLFNLCHGCFRKYRGKRADVVPYVDGGTLDDARYEAEPDGVYGVSTVTEDHPSYADDDLNCDCCGRVLTAQDD